MLHTNFKKDAGIYFANYMIENKCTLRDTAKHFGVSKSKVASDISKLEKEDYTLFIKVRTLLDYNKSQRAFRGGSTTKKRYKGVSKCG